MSWLLGKSKSGTEILAEAVLVAVNKIEARLQGLEGEIAALKRRIDAAENKVSGVSMALAFKAGKKPEAQK